VAEMEEEEEGEGLDMLDLLCEQVQTDDFKQSR
jgi:hypothetical protein